VCFCELAYTVLCVMVYASVLIIFKQICYSGKRSHLAVELLFKPYSESKVYEYCMSMRIFYAALHASCMLLLKLWLHTVQQASRISYVRVYLWHSPTAGLPNHELSARKVNKHSRMAHFRKCLYMVGPVHDVPGLTSFASRQGVPWMHQHASLHQKSIRINNGGCRC
jgi:hypothetical protein